MKIHREGALHMALQKNEYSTLKQVIVCPPTYMEITTIINETQKHFIDENIDKVKADKQHDRFTEILREHNVETISLDAKKHLNEQVFTRDIGFTIDETVFISQMARDIRKEEVHILEDYLNQNEIPSIRLQEHSIEGGDIIVHEDVIYVGISKRTTPKAVEELQNHVSDKQIISLPIREDVLHLDCAFNIISNEHALIYTPAFQQEDVEQLEQQFTLIETPEDEQLSLATNVFSIGNKTVISLPENKKTNQALRNRGYQVIETDFSEIIKSGGSFRCCTMPIQRQK